MIFLAFFLLTANGSTAPSIMFSDASISSREDSGQKRDLIHSVISSQGANLPQILPYSSLAIDSMQLSTAEKNRIHHRKGQANHDSSLQLWEESIFHGYLSGNPVLEQNQSTVFMNEVTMQYMYSQLLFLYNISYMVMNHIWSIPELPSLDFRLHQIVQNSWELI